MAKKLEELGISPCPWHTFDDNWVESADGNQAMSNAAYACNQNNALLIAAAPDLYECLREAIAQTCLCCLYKKCEECKVVNKWKAALAKASGEEVAK